MSAQMPSGVGECGREPMGLGGRYFVISSGVVLAVTGVAKLLTAAGGAPILRVVDPMFGVPFGYLLTLVGVAEITVAGLCFAPCPSVPRKAALVAGLASGFLVYRASLWFAGWQRPCSCLGQLTDVLGLTEKTADVLSAVLLAYLLAGSYFLVLCELAQRRRKVAPATTDKWVVQRCAPDSV